MRDVLQDSCGFGRELIEDVAVEIKKLCIINDLPNFNSLNKNFYLMKRIPMLSGRECYTLPKGQCLIRSDLKS